MSPWIQHSRAAPAEEVFLTHSPSGGQGFLPPPHSLSPHFHHTCRPCSVHPGRLLERVWQKRKGPPWGSPESLCSEMGNSKHLFWGSTGV